jgi:hypothetical protein
MRPPKIHLVARTVRCCWSQWWTAGKESDCFSGCDASCWRPRETPINANAKERVKGSKQFKGKWLCCGHQGAVDDSYRIQGRLDATVSSSSVTRFPLNRHAHQPPRPKRRCQLLFSCEYFPCFWPCCHENMQVDSSRDALSEIFWLQLDPDECGPSNKFRKTTFSYSAVIKVPSLKDKLLVCLLSDFIETKTIRLLLKLSF